MADSNRTPQPLANNFKIVNEDGFPTEYFIRWAQERQIAIEDGITAAQAQELIDEWSAQREIIAGVAIHGGGALSADVTIDHDDSAVVPGTYGDATHTPQFTVDQQGHVTAVANVPISGGGGGPSAALYWQIRCLGNQSNFFGITEIQMAASSGGANLCTGGTPNANLATYGPASGAFDGNPATFWAVDNKPVACWISYQFAAAVLIKEVKLTARSGSDSPQCPMVFAVEYSNDGIAWAVAWLVQTAQFTSSQTKTFLNTL